MNPLIATAQARMVPVQAQGLAVVEGQHFALHTASMSLLGVDPHHPDRRTIELWNA